LLANGCEVLTPRAQFCCGSIHAHNGELELAKQMARRNLDAFDLERLDAVITNAAGCGTHLKNYGHLLQDDPAFMERAMKWSAKVRDIHEWLVEIGIRAPAASIPQTVTYHEACHLCHGQKITREPRQVLKAIPGLELVELPESNWCCGSAGIYNLIQPEMSQTLLRRKMANIATTAAQVVASANPGCSVQLQTGVRELNLKLKIAHPISLLAEVPQLSQHALAFKRLCEQIQAIFSTTFWMIFGDVGSAKPRCASSWATGLSGRATRRRRSWPRFLTGRITSMERIVETSNRS
jgi:glycolate oxidase iron-sulfur subunit